MNPPESRPAAAPDNAQLLVVDPDGASIATLASLLAPHGCVVAGAGSGEQALALSDELQPDLVLLALTLPGIGSLETCHRLRQAHGRDGPPILLLTAPGETDDDAAGLAAGAADYLRKPFQPSEVVARIRTHLALQRLAREEKSLHARLRDADAAKNRFLGKAAHDLRNPLGGIRGLAEFLRDGTVGELSADQLDLVNTIHAASESMLGLVNDLLDVATIEAGELKIQPAPCNLAELIERSVHLARIDATRKKMHLSFRPQPGLPAAAADAPKIKQVVDNLLSNAVKYSPPGSTITVELHGNGERCTFTVKDQGPGIPEHERDKLFKDFGRLSVKPTGGELSTGLGLAICRKIVESHGGTITAENLPAGGCGFRVTLPMWRDE